MKQQSEPDKHPAPAADDSNLGGFLGARAAGPHKQCVAGSRHMRLPRPCQAPACGGKPAPVKDGYHCIGKTYHMVLSTLCRGGPLACVPIGAMRPRGYSLANTTKN